MRCFLERHHARALRCAWTKSVDQLLTTPVTKRLRGRNARWSPALLQSVRIDDRERATS